MEASENRQHIRVPLNLPISCKYAKSFFNSHRFQGETRDISYGGLGIMTDNPNGFKVGQKLKFRVQLYPGDFKIKGEGIVCWVDEKKVPDRPINMGVRLDRIRRYGIWCEKIEKNIHKMG